MKKRVIILCSICLIVLIGGIIADKIISKEYFQELKYKDFIEKTDNKDTFVLCISQTECTHCLSYKPKLKSVANKYKLTVYYLDTDLLSEEEYNNFTNYFSFDGTPTTVFINDGEEKTAASRINGDASEEKIINKLKSNGFIK